MILSSMQNNQLDLNNNCELIKELTMIAFIKYFCVFNDIVWYKEILFCGWLATRGHILNAYSVKILSKL